MPTFDDLAKQGIRYHQLDDTPAEQPQQEESGDFARGFKKAMLQVPQTLGGTAALVGDLAGSQGLKELGLGIYQNNADKIQAITKDSDSLSNVLEGDASGADWLANSAGYVGGQALQAIATGGVGGFIGSQLAKRGIANVVSRGASSLAAREVAGKVASRGAAIGAGSALLGSNVVQEAGSIYPEALHVAAEQGRELTGQDKARVVGSALAAAGVDTAMDAVMLGRVLKGGRKAGESMLRAGVREVPGAMAREGITEGIQTGIERYGAGQELNTADAIRDFVDSIGVGVVGGGMGGAASVLRAQKVPESGPLTRAANTAIEQQILQLEYDPQPLISFPDGSVGHKQDLAAYLSQFADPEERQRKEREIMGRDPETGKRIQPEPEPEPKFVSSEEAERQNMQAWGARHEGVPLDYAQSLVRSPGAKGMGLMVVPHPKGNLYTVIPSKWLTLHTQAQYEALQKGDQGMLPGPDREAPGGAIRVDSEGGAAPETYGEQVRTAQGQRAQQAVVEAQIAREKDLGKQVPHGADVPVLTDAIPNASELPEIPTLTDIITAPSGNPFKTEFAARRRMTQDGLTESHDLLPVDGGFILQPKAEASNADNTVLAQDSGLDGGSSRQPDTDLGSGESVGDRAATPGNRGLAAADVGAGQAVQPDPVRGTAGADADAALDGDWHQFSPETGTLAIPRADMPQIKAEHRGAMTNFLNARGIKHQQEEIPADQLKPTQAEFSLSKVEKAKAYEGGERSILVSSDGHVLDGHHQWLAAFEKGEPVKAIRLNAPIADLITQVKEFPSATTEEASDVPQPAQVPEESQAASREEGAAQPEAAPTKPSSRLDQARAKHAKQDDAVAQAAANIAARKAAKEAAPDVDDGADIPAAFFAKVKVPAEVFNEETGATATGEVTADVALAAVREDIANLQALIKCMKGGK